MATGATGQLGLALPVQGELSGTWGDTVNNGITQYTNIAIAATLTLTGDGAVTLANTTGDASASNITSTLAGAGTVTAQFAMVRVSGTTVAKTVTGPSYSKSYIIDNASSFSVTFKASGQTGVSISPGEKVGVYYNGTDYVKIGGGGITYGAVKTTTYTAVANDGVLTNTTSAAFTVNLPATPSTGTQVFIADSAGTWGTNNLTIGRNGSTIEGSATDLVCDINSVSIQCVYNGTTWDIFAQIGANDTAVVTLNGTQTLTNKTLTSPTITSPTVTGTGAIAAATVTLSSTLSVTGVSTLTGGAVIQGLTVGRGAGAVATNTAVGAAALNNGSLSGGENVGLGYNSAQGLTTGVRNTILGSQSGQNLTTGSDNILIGYRTVYNATSTGSNNVAVGNQSLYSNTTASYNTVSGYQAGYSNTTGQYNCYVGNQAGYTNTVNSANVAMGHSALYYNTGASNVAIGHASLSSNTADNNTAVGYQAGYSNTTGGITAFGYQAGYANQTGLRCVFLGRGAGFSSTGDNNTFVGYGAGNASTGVNNTFVGGYNSSFGAAGGDMTTGSKNTIIGTYTGNQGGLDIRTASNYIVLSDGDGNPRVTVNGSGNVGFGTITSPSGASGGTAFVSAGAYGVTRLLFSSTSTATVALLQWDNPNGNIGSISISGSSTSYNTSSDYRLKNTIAPMTGALAKVALLKPCTYKWNADGSDGEGFIAHELAEVCPQAVVGDKDAMDENGKIKPQGIDTSFLVATLTAAIQEQQAIITAQAADIAALKAKVGL